MNQKLFVFISILLFILALVPKKVTTININMNKTIPPQADISKD